MENRDREEWTKISEDSWFDMQSVEHRYHFALVLGTYSDSKPLAIAMMQTIVEEFVLEKQAENIRYLLLSYIAIGKLQWQYNRSYRTAQHSFDQALAVIDDHPELIDLAGKVFYERCLILSDMEKGDIALQGAFELVDSYDLYGKRAKSKKMFYVFMAIATIAKEEWIYDIGLDYLWRAFQQLRGLPAVVVKHCRTQYKKRHLDTEQAFYAIHDQLEQFL